MTLLYLITAHLLADFVFQPDRLLQWKMKSAWGIFVHSLVHLIVTGIIIFPYLKFGSAWIALAVILVTHFFTDYTKISMELKSDKHIVPFLVDQFLHFIVIAGVSDILSGMSVYFPNRFFFLNIYLNMHIFFFITLAIFFTYTLEIYRYQRLRETAKVEKLAFPYYRMAERVIMLALLYGAMLVAGFRAAG